MSQQRTARMAMHDACYIVSFMCVRGHVCIYVCMLCVIRTCDLHVCIHACMYHVAYWMRSLMPQGVAVMCCHLRWRTFLKFNKTNYACLPSVLESMSVYAFTYVCMYACMYVSHVFTHVCACACACACACICVCVCIGIYVCVCACLFLYV